MLHFPCLKKVFPSLWEGDRCGKLMLAQRVAGNLACDVFCGLSFCLSGVSSKKKEEPGWGNLREWGPHDISFGYPY